uniref:CDKN2A interacting protein N-terminal like n=1 Tax=Gasterosteus aculeatus aculeatus TaxID=481459 RepID=A0AAQ4RQ00_GASAC
MANMDVEDFIQQNRALAEQVETFRGYWESEKHWEARREFILRNISDYEDPHLDQLVSLSMVWANNVFLGCRYSSVLLEKVKDMAEGVVVEDAPVFKTRDEIMKKQKVCLSRTHPHTSCVSKSLTRFMFSSLLSVSDGTRCSQMVLPRFLTSKILCKKTCF